MVTRIGARHPVIMGIIPVVMEGLMTLMTISTGEYIIMTAPIAGVTVVQDMVLLITIETSDLDEGAADLTPGIIPTGLITVAKVSVVETVCNMVEVTIMDTEITVVIEDPSPSRESIGMMLLHLSIVGITVDHIPAEMG